MSRWIDAEWIRNVYADFDHYDNRNDWTTPIANVLAVIDDAPRIDIVRCAECAFKDTDRCPMDEVYLGGINDDDFCSCGERKRAVRLIDADALIAKMPAVMDMQDTYLPIHFKEWLIDEAPTIEPKRGEWIYGEHDVAMCDGYRCNRCDFFVPWDYEHKFIDFINDYHYCPNCGADMREREGE